MVSECCRDGFESSFPAHEVGSEVEPVKSGCAAYGAVFVYPAAGGRLPCIHECMA